MVGDFGQSRFHPDLGLSWLSYQMPPENLVPDHRVKVLVVRAAESDSGNWTKGRISLIWPIQDRLHPSLLIANLNTQERRYKY